MARGSSRAHRRVLGCLVLVAAAATLPFVPAGRHLASRLTGLTQDAGLVRELTPPPKSPRAPRLFLVVGNDSRERIREDAGDRFGPVDTLTGERADAVMLLRVAPSGGRVHVLSLPRDLQVDVEGVGPQRLSVVLGLGGSRLLVRTVRAVTGLPIHHYVELDFVGFADVVDRLGGVTMAFERPSRDFGTGFEASAGVQRLDGAAALTYVRSRRFEELRNGEWVPLDDGDKGRIVRQHDFLRALVTQVGSGPKLALVRQLRDLGGHVTVDAGLSVEQMLKLARQLAGPMLAADVQTLPTEAAPDSERQSPFPPAHSGGVHHERVVEPAATAVIRAFRAGGSAV